MSNVMMRIEGVTVSGSATVAGLLDFGDLTKGSIKAKNEWFNIDDIKWGASKKGSGLNVLAPITVKRKVDGASAKLISFFFSPGETGEKVELAFTKEASSGEGVVKYYQIKLSNVKISYYKINANEGKQPEEILELSYSEITQCYNTDNADKMETSGDVTFDLSSASLTAGIKDDLK